VAQTENRRFYNSPDVSLVQSRGVAPYFNIAIGSGYRGHPLDTSTTDRFYSIRDKQPLAHWTQTTYNSFTAILDGGLTDITSNPGTIAVPYSQPGWKLSMTRNGSGEKVLSDSTTVNNIILFTSFQPQTSAAGPCYPSSQNRAYAVSVFSGKPSLDFNDDGVVDVNDLSTNLGQAGIAGQINVAFLRDGTNNANNGGPQTPRTVCMAGPEILKRCVSAGGTVRTFWRRNDAQ
jgi:type IV pilus assembly protein PilY1